VSHQGSSYSYQPFNSLTAANGTTFGYDTNGNLTSKADASGSWIYTWDYENRLKQATLSGGIAVAYSYDALGRRIQRTSSATGTTKFVYDGADVVRDLDGSGSAIADYLNGPGIDDKLRESVGSTLAYFLSDHLGTIRTLADASGGVTSNINYDTYGQVTGGSTPTRYTYTGRESDSDTGLLYYRARWYDSHQGRFISEDPIGIDAGINWYAYVENDPAGSSDPFGLKPLPKSRTRTRPCNAAEMSECSRICGPRGVQSCMVSQTFRIVRIKDRLAGWQWMDGPMSCSCNECEEKTVPVPIPMVFPRPSTNPRPRIVPVPVPSWLPHFFTIPLIMVDPCLVYPQLCFTNNITE